MVYRHTKTESDTPKVTTIEKHYICIMFNETKKEKTDEFNKSHSYYEYDTIQVWGGIPTYDSLVSFLIREKYSQDTVESIINNYLETQEDKDFNELQSYRKECKDIAKKAIELYNLYK